MDLRLTRREFGPEATIGDLDVNGVPFCVTLEDTVRPDPNPTTPQNEAKVYGKTAIPAGRYKVDITWSPKFGKMMLAILEVPGYTGIRIHSGNDPEDTLGCVLVGHTVDGPTRIHGGSVVLPRLFAQVREALDRGEGVWIEVADA